MSLIAPQRELGEPKPQPHTDSRFNIEWIVAFKKRLERFTNSARTGQWQGIAGANQTTISMRAAAAKGRFFNQRDSETCFP